jgi:peroxiredoxin
MAQVRLNTEAPDFTLADYRGAPVTLSSFRGRRHVLLVFNRGFT